MRGITPFLWFDGQAEEAARFYVSIFPDSRITDIARNGEAGTDVPGSVLTVAFELRGQRFVALNGGPDHPLTDAVSFMVECDSQEEIDHYWERLGDGGRPVACGWLTDRYGVSWQITPRALLDMIADEDREKADRVMRVMMEMVKLDLPALQAAYTGSSSRG